jgi:hypothetical protein
MEIFQKFDLKKFSSKRNNLTFRISIKILKKLAEKHCNQSSTSYLSYLNFMKLGCMVWEEVKKQENLENSDELKNPFDIESETDDSVSEDDLFHFLKQVGCKKYTPKY